MTRLDVPVIDLAGNDGEVAAQIDSACREWGFFQVLGHDISAGLSARMVAASGEFFAQPTAEKNRIRRTSTNPWGFYDAELTKNTRDWKEIVDVGPTHDEQVPQWPQNPAQFRELVEEYSLAARAVAVRLTTAVLANLGDAQARELDGFTNDASFLRLNFYPACPNPAPADLATDTKATTQTGHLGISHHTDAGALTVLHQSGPAGLQVLHDNQWHRVEVLTDALVINIGDVAQVWSNDAYPAPLHRVLANSAAERYSAAYFFNPKFGYDYAPLAADQPPAYRPINWGEFRAGRAAGDYSDQGEEIQISHYRI